MRLSIAVALLALLLVLLASNAVYEINEGEQAFIMQFGEARGGPIVDAGLHFKLPLIQEVKRYEKRFLEWDGSPNQLPTRDKRFIWVDTYARWRISDPIRYFERLGNELGAQSRLDDILDGETRNAIANHDLVEVVRSTNRTPLAENETVDTLGTLDPISYGRDRIRQEILAAAQGRTQDLGIEILDFQFKRINYVSEVQEKVYDRMMAERRRIADRFRSEGEGEASRILGEMDRELKRIQSEAYREAQQITGRADAEAIEIYAGAYNQSAEARRFYEFLKSMETLRSTADSDTWLVLSNDGDLYRFLTGDRP